MHIRRTPRPNRHHPRTRGGRTARTLAAAVTALLLVPACSSGSGGEPHRTAPVAETVLPSSVPSALASYYGQKPAWRDCGVPGFECTTIKAPLDYERPDAGDVRLAVARKKATGPGKRLGSLLVNPGGPGGSAITYLQQFAGVGYPEQVRARYDMVAMDPRGVARSEPITCLDDRAMDQHTQVDVTPDDRGETDALVDAHRKFAEGCGTRSSRLLRHVSTADAARDMDILRAVLGDGRLNYVGASYGTLLGATYADLFPDRVGRLVLDGGIDPSLSSRQLNLDQTKGFETAFQAFAKDCVQQSDCPLGGPGTTPQQVGDRLAAFFRKLDAQPIPTGDAAGRRLGEALATTGVIAAMYNKSAWPQLREALTSAMEKNDGSALLALADSYYERDASGRYSNLMYANAAVNCLDLPPAFTGREQLEEALPAFEKASPVFGRTLAWSSLNCAYWPVKPVAEPRRVEARGAAPIVVVGTTRDPATPYRWSQSLAGQLSSARLLTYDGDGHTAYNRGSGCIDSTINTYLLQGTPPPDGKRCT